MDLAKEPMGCIDVRITGPTRIHASIDYAKKAPNLQGEKARS